jgi:hypothetical protein
MNQTWVQRMGCTTPAELRGGAGTVAACIGAARLLLSERGSEIEGELGRAWLRQRLKARGAVGPAGAPPGQRHRRVVAMR